MNINFKMGWQDLAKICPILEGEVKLGGKEKIFVKTISDERTIEKIIEEVDPEIIGPERNFIMALFYKKRPIAIAFASFANNTLNLGTINVMDNFRKKGISTLLFAFGFCLIRYMQIRHSMKEISTFAPTDEIKNLCEEKFGFPPLWADAELTPKMVLEWAKDAINLKKLDEFIRGK